MAKKKSRMALLKEKVSELEDRIEVRDRMIDAIRNFMGNENFQNMIEVIRQK